jgi:hypothetical protein
MYSERKFDFCDYTLDFCFRILVVQDNSQDIYAYQYIFSAMEKKKMRPNEGNSLQIVFLGLSHNDSEPKIGEFDTGLSEGVVGVFGRNIFVFEHEGVFVDFFDNLLRSREFVRTGATYAAASLAGLTEIFILG